MGDYCQENSLSALSPTNTCVPELNCNPYVLRFSDLKKWMFCPKDGWDWTLDEHSLTLKNERRNSRTQSAWTSYNTEQSDALSNLKGACGKKQVLCGQEKSNPCACASFLQQFLLPNEQQSQIHSRGPRLVSKESTRNNSFSGHEATM